MTKPHAHESKSKRESELIRSALEDAASDRSTTGNSRSIGGFIQNWPFDSTHALPGYAILGEIHRGGQGIVYRATQHATGRTVAIKFLRDFALAGADEESRFRREVRFLARIKHPNIVAIHDSAVVNGRPFFVMDFIEGLPLHTFLNTRSWSVERTLQLFRQICDAVHAAHVRGIIHRDLKPDNILVDERDEPHILDFGLARLIDDEGVNQTQFQPATQEGQFVGSLPWASPEQAEGRQELIDTRSDVYSLGVILYQILTGHFPYNVRGNVRDVADRILNVEPVRPGLLRKEINVEVETIVLKCLNKQRERRYQSGGELAQDIGRYLAGEPVEARRDSALYVLGKHLRKHRVSLAVVTSFVVLLAVSSVVGWTLYVHAQHATNAARAAESEKTDKLWDAYVAQARVGRFSRMAGQRFDGLRALAEAAKIRPTMELRNEAIACLALPDLRIESEIRFVDRAGTVTTVDARQSLWATSGANGDISIKSIVDNREVVSLAGSGNKVIAIQFSPDGKHMAAVYGRGDDDPKRYCLWDIKNHKVAMEYDRRGSWVTDFNGDGASWALVLEDGVTILDVKNATELKHIPLDYKARVLSLSFDGSKLAVVPNLSKQIDVVDAQTGLIIQIVQAPTIIARVAWHPNGRWLAGASQTDFSIYLWNLATGQTQVFQAHTATNLDFSSNGEFLLSSGWDSSIRLWSVECGEQLCTIPGTLRGRFGSDTSEMGRHGFKRPSGELGMLDVDYASECRALRAHAGVYKAPDWVDVRREQLDDDQIPVLAASCGIDGVRLWDLERTRELAWLPIGEVDSVLFEPKGDGFTTSGPRGVHMWPMQLDGGGMHVGPPRKVWDRESGVAALNADGRRLVTPTTSSNPAGATREAVLIKRDEPGSDVLRLPHNEVNYVDISPDGRWVATGTWQSSGVKVWNADDGSFITDLLAPEGSTPEEQRDESALVKFSPNSRWLATSTAHEVVFWEAGTWRRLKGIATRYESNVPPRVAFSDDGSMMATNLSPHLIMLYDTETLTELGTLEPPRRESIRAICFSSDGSRLVVGNSENLLRIWDLRAIRLRLKEMGLDWNGLAYPDAQGPISIQDLQVKTTLGELELTNENLKEN